MSRIALIILCDSLLSMSKENGATSPALGSLQLVDLNLLTTKLQLGRLLFSLVGHKE